MARTPGNYVAATIRRGLFTRIVGRRVLYHHTLGSTMDEASRLAVEGTTEGTVVVAETQRSGRGRFGRNWVSPEGNILFSVVFRPSLENLPLLSIMGGLATAQAVRKTTGLHPRIKWPNDVVLEGMKTAGVLAESVVEGGNVCYAVLGIGLNVALDPEQSEETSGLATSLEKATGRTWPREVLLGQLLTDLDSLYLKLRQGQSPLAPWRELLDTIGQRVRVTWKSGFDPRTGIAEDVDDAGNLLLRLDDGSLVTVTAGDVTLAQ